ncbi:hypothetical protein [Stenomitos frigidus]|uniref:Uncharacterized protein n=1 Tax=Stenomitos frigidus ULC18 TaxID=2107698 RepID=A0A2T1EEP8_9CYAN|nr:hypothetical protein [Stenomitos frigidus]PSB31222.1 hypothetical protein C7B82_07560 [Stenomitos frigidus ULC18]
MIHLLLLGLAALLLSGIQAPVIKFLGLLLFGVPLVLLASDGFHFLFEKPFVSERAKAGS